MNLGIPNDSGFGRRSGFSLIELIGVLTVLALLASVVTESVLSRVAATQRQAEEAELSRMVTCVERMVRRNHRLPGPSDWSSIVAEGLGCPHSLIRTNPQGVPRLWLPDPGWTVAGRDSGMAYRQDAYGTPKPERIRALLISPSNGTLLDPAGLDFESWWERSSEAVPVVRSEDVKLPEADILVERIGFAPLFHRVVLNNLSTDLPARWAVDRIEDAGSCGPGRRHEAHYMDTSRLLLIDSSGSIQEVVLVESASSWVFEAGRWHRSLSAESGSAVTSLTRISSDLAALPAVSGLEPLEIADAMYDFMGAYLRWSADGYRAEGIPAAPIPPSQRRVVEAAERLMDVAGRFLGP
jgi:prepilin-type N-terminal cleavage/methylation domain-containing protein